MLQNWHANDSEFQKYYVEENKLFRTDTVFCVALLDEDLGIHKHALLCEKNKDNKKNSTE